jgi:serine/threonine protein kinase
MGKYEIVKDLQGHLTQVFLARSEDNYVVLRGVLQEGYGEVLDEEMVLRQLNHPDISRFIEKYTCEDSGREYLVVEYFPGESLKELKGRVPPPLLAFYIGRIADALKHLHSKRIVHRDVKPKNIVCSDVGTRLIDFNIAGALGGSLEEGYIGSPSYMSLEHWDGMCVPSMDVFGLGCTSYEVQTGRHPYYGIKVTKDEFRESPTYYLKKGPEEKLSQGLENDMIMAMIEPREQNRPTLDEVLQVFPYAAMPPGISLSPHPLVPLTVEPQVTTSSPSLQLLHVDPLPPPSTLRRLGRRVLDFLLE